MTNEELQKLLSTYPPGSIVAGFNRDGDSGNRYYKISQVVVVKDIEWISDIVRGIEQKPVLVLLGKEGLTTNA